MMRNRKWMVPLLAVWLLAGLSGCVVMDSGDWGDFDQNNSEEARAAFDRVFSLGQKSRLVLEAINGHVTITGDPSATQVRVWGERIVASDDLEDAQDHLSDLRVDFDEGSSTLVVRTLQPSHNDGRTYRVDYFVRLPAHWRLDVELVNGPLCVDSLSGNVDLAVVNGQIDAQGLTGNLEAALTNGQFTGDVVLPVQGRCEIDITNGDINLDIPSATSATFTAGVVNGGVSVSGLTLDGFNVTNRLVSGVLGGGDGEIKLGVVNGRIQVAGR